MIEKIKHIRNPLTIVAIFAALAEMAGIVSPATIDERHHNVIVWFLTLFPVLLLVLFFFTLWFRPGVLYGPSDFRDERIFLEMLTATQKATLELDSIATQFQNSNKQVIDEMLSYNSSQKEDTNRISKLITNETSQLISRIDSARSSLEQYTMNIPPHVLPQSRLQNDVFHELRKSPEGLSFSQICEKIKRDRTDIKKALDRMVQRHIIKTMECPDGIL